MKKHPSAEARAIVKVMGFVFLTLATLATLTSLVLQILHQDSASSTPGTSGLNVVVHLGGLTAIGYFILWALAERIFGWEYGSGGGDSLPTGWSAIVLSLSATLPVVLIPPFYQAVTRINVLPPFHWRASIIMIFLGIFSHLLMYGTSSNGIRQRYAPTGDYSTFYIAVLLEAIYTTVYFGFIVFPYRFIAQPADSVITLLLKRTLLPAFFYFSCMLLFSALKYPGSLHNRTWIQVRGFLAGILMMFCFCAGMFL